MSPLKASTLLLLTLGSSLRSGLCQPGFYRPPFWPFGYRGYPSNFNPFNTRTFRQAAATFPARQLPISPRLRANTASVSSSLASQQLLNFVNVFSMATAYRRVLQSISEDTQTATEPPQATTAPAVTSIPMEWSSWTPWTTCSREECGFQERSRTCVGGSGCIGNNKEGIPCNQVRLCSFPGKWSEWGSWGQCSPLCNGGRQKRTRTCSAGDFQCFGNSMEFKACPNENPNRFRYGDRCYEVYNVDMDTRFNRIQSNEICAATKGALADIISQEHQELLIAEAKKTVTASYKRFGFWLGMTVDDSDNVFLSTGEAAPYVDWAAGSPVSVSPCSPNLVLAISSDSTRDGLHAVNEFAPRRGAICEYVP